MRRLAVVAFSVFALIPVAAQAQDCSGVTPQPLPSRPTIISPVASELYANTTQLGAPSGVLAQAYDEAQSVDRVLLRIKAEGCKNVAMALPAPAAVSTNSSAAYKPKTQFDNTPWRFDMNQNGKRMTAEEFDAWMKSRGVRVAKGAGTVAAPAAPPAPAAAPAPVEKKK